MIEKTYNVGIYCRLSNDDERDGESVSIENQKLLLQDYVRQRGWNEIDTYIDDGYSGTNFDRPGVKRLIEDVKAKKINLILVKDLSRLGRNYLKTGELIEVIFPEYDVRYIAINDGVDTAREDNEFTPLRNWFKNKVHSGKVICDFSFFRRFGIINRCFLRSCGMFAIRYRRPSAIGSAVAASAEM